ncbi:cobalamin biosynthesis protein CobD [Oxalicibacterium flavum]|uniref:Cobalamin biosynthesis protein CobD n=1 Tax=Oxalicibacterium flavum TaxID=179467 RepID=A0A8J2XXB0_9BURK|nr:CobD/CbiB family protein [Oxalicibacterium flavum]GGB97747.1 cobalamin biosynthesis protein CobD [Oxalicibacterium flavum]
MTFFSILFALLIEQLKPLRADNPVYAGARALAAQIERSFNAGQAHQGRLAWLLMILAFTVPVALLYWIAIKIGILAVLILNVLVVYLTLGFRHYSHFFTSIQLALNNGDEATARSLLGEWTRRDTAGMDASEVARIAVETALITTHRNVFGVFFWMLTPLGPIGAVMYRVAEYLARIWNEPGATAEREAFGRFASKAFYWIDWIPVRLTAAAFAVVGNFEDAIYAWRNFAARWQDEAIGIILSSGGGAMGIRLGAPAEVAADIIPSDAGIVDSINIETEAPLGEEASVRALQSTVGLVWRALLLWMFLVLLLSIASWLG